MDNVKEDLKEKNIVLTMIGEATRNREVWRCLIHHQHAAGGEKRRSLLRFKVKKQRQTKTALDKQYNYTATEKHVILQRS